MRHPSDGLLVNQCTRAWGICPDSLLPGESLELGEPHECMHAAGHHDGHLCGTCAARLPLDGNETSALEDPRLNY